MKPCQLKKECARKYSTGKTPLNVGIWLYLYDSIKGCGISTRFKWNN